MSKHTRRGRMTLTCSADYMYPSFDPFEEDLEFDYRMFEDADEALAVMERRSQRKRYMVGLFPGVNESFLQRDSIRKSPLFAPSTKPVTGKRSVRPLCQHEAQVPRST